MKTVLRVVPMVVVLLAVSPVFGQGGITPGDPGTYPSISVVETPHNLNLYPGVEIEGNRVCLPCHTPHNALIFGEEGVLWNHAETEETFVMYYSQGPGSQQPQGPSRLCLSCHDGVTAIDNYGGTGGTGITITGDANLGTDLSNDHPIGIEYPDDVTQYRPPTEWDAGVGNGPGVHLVTIGEEDRVECTSCHNVHNNGLGDFLLVPIQESYLCLQCHIK